MDEFCRITVYIIAANVAYLIFSLFRQGFKHYSNYIAQLMILLVGILWLTQKDISIWWVLLISALGVLLLVILPIFLQGQIDALMGEGRYDEVEMFARLKANIAWSAPNEHLLDIAEIASKYSEAPVKMVESLRELQSRGEPYDSMTRLFLGVIHFNSRNFNDLISDLRVKDKGVDAQSFEELLYLVRAYLETTRYEEAVEAQIELEKKVYEEGGNKADRKANAVINRFVFYAFMGWKDEYDAFLKSDEENLARLPDELRDFWRGVCCFYHGDYTDGERQMQSVISKLPEESVVWQDFMRKRLYGMMEHKTFFNDHVLSKLKDLHEKYSGKITELISTGEKGAVEVAPNRKATDFLAFVISLVSIIFIVAFNVNDSIELINMGAVSSVLVKEGEYFRLVAYMFIHVGWLHLVMNLVALRYFGPLVETIGGWSSLALVFVLSGIAGGAFSVYMGNPLTVGASGGVLGLLSASIIFEMFKLRGKYNYSSHGSFSTLMFILAVNLAFGYFEQGIDNSAHFGGLMMGALTALLLVPAVKYKAMRKVVNVMSAMLCVGILSLSLWQHVSLFSSEGFYPATASQFKLCDVASCSFRLEIPISWKIEEKSSSFQELNLRGPFRENMNVSVYLNNELPEPFIKKYVDRKTSEFEREKDLELKSFSGPEKIDFRNYCYRIKWNISVYGRAVSIDEYVILEQGFVYVMRLFVPSAHTEAYKEIMKQAVKSIQFKT